MGGGEVGAIEPPNWGKKNPITGKMDSGKAKKV